MGGGTWTSQALCDYATSRGMSSDGRTITSNVRLNEMYRNTNLDAALCIKNKVRECCDSDEHPNTVPVIFAIDVTGSMGSAAMEVAKKIGQLISSAMENGYDNEFCIMGIGDTKYDSCPVQMSQFESDIRIMEQLDRIYFEGHGGGNHEESYSAAWYAGVYHAKLDCWKRGKKGVIITIGDEKLNTKLYHLDCFFGDEEREMYTETLWDEVTAKYDVYHIDILHHHRAYESEIIPSWSMLGDHFKQCRIDELIDVATEIIRNNNTVTPTTMGEWSW